MQRLPSHVLRRGARYAIAALVAVMTFTPGAQAQTTTSSIRGYVRDQVGGALADAQISLRNVDMGLLRSTTSNASGFYNLSGVRPGNYEMTVRRIGFAPRNQALQVPIAQTLALDFSLQSTAVTLQAVTVTSSNVTVKTSEVGTNISPEQIDNLPIFDRNVLDLAKLVPGITPQNVNETNKFISAGGQPAEAVNIFLDGATYKNDVLKGGVLGQDASKGNPFPQGAMQEFRVVTQNYKAEYQKASSAVIVATTKSGTNQWEGDAFAYGVGSSYVAKDAFTARQGGPRSDYKRLQAGGTLGGPIKTDKWFFFGTYELNARDEPQNIVLGSQAALAPPGLNPQQYTGAFTSEFREHLGFGKLTWAKSDRSTVEASVNLRNENDFRNFGGQTSFESAENLHINVLTGVANWKYAGGTWLNEAQINGQNFIWNPEPKNPNLVGKNYFNIIRIGGRDTKQKFTQNRLSLRDDITRSPIHWSGDHVIKAGTSLDFLTYESIKNFNGNPVFNLRDVENYAFPFEAFFGYGDPKINAHNTQLGYYLQDDWDLTRKLTLNLGLRWDIETNPINNGYVTPQPLADSLRNQLSAQLFVDQPTPAGTTQRRVIDELGGLDRFITAGRSDRPIYWGAVQPRFGASYDIKGDASTVLFGGAGVYFDRNYWNTLLDEQFRRQYKVLQMQFNATGPTGACPRCVQWNDQYYDPAQLQALAASGNSGLPEVFLVANDLKPPKTYQLSAGVRQRWHAEQFTLSYNGVRGYNGMNFVRASPWGGLGPNYAQAFVTDDRVRTWYDALQLQVERPFTSATRWGGALAYTLSKSQEQGQSTDIFWGFDDRYPTVGDLPKKRPPGSQTHTIVANGVTRVPYGFMLSGIVTLGTGIASTATDASAGWGAYQQRFYVFNPPTKPFLGIGHVFATQNLDARLEKEFKLPSNGQTVGLVFDVFNAFNTENWGCFDATIFPTSGAPNANYGRPSCAALGRRLQIGLRYGAKPTK